MRQADYTVNQIYDSVIPEVTSSPARWKGILTISDGNVIRISKKTNSIWSLFHSVFPIVILIGTLLLLACYVIAHYLTKSLCVKIEK